MLTHVDLAQALTALALTYSIDGFAATVLPYRRSDAVLLQAPEREWSALHDLMEDIADAVDDSGVELRAGRNKGLVLFAIVPVPGSDTAGLAITVAAMTAARVDWPI